MTRTWIRIISILSGLLIFPVILVPNISGFQHTINSILSGGSISKKTNSYDELSVSVMQNIESWIDTNDNKCNGCGTFDEIKEIDGQKNQNINLDTLTDALNYELNMWIKVIENKLNSAIPSLTNDINKEISKLIHLQNDTVWLPLLKEWEIKRNIEEVSIKSYIDDIQCNGEWNPHSEMMIYYNKDTGKGISQYVTRPLINSMISKSLNNLIEFYNRLNSTLNEIFTTEYEATIDQSINLHMTMFEEWGESVFTEWSQRMANNDFLWDEKTIPISIWEKYLTIKKNTINKYNELKKFQPISSEWHRFLNNCQTQLNVTFDKYNQNLNKLMDFATKEFEIRDSTEKP